MKKIAIVGWNTGDNSFGITKPYAEYFSQFGKLIILTPSDEIVEGIDLLVLPGGLDLAPSSMFGVAPSYYTSNTDVMKQYFYETTLPQYIMAGIPIFGICLGFQQLSAYFGAKLQQHVPYYASGENRGKLVDILKVNPDYVNFVVEAFKEVANDKFYKRMSRSAVLSLEKSHGIDKEELKNNILQYYPANSIHHQGVEVLINPQGEAYVDGSSISVVSYNPLFENLEAAYFSNNIAGVQYHPEHTNCPVAKKMILELLK